MGCDLYRISVIICLELCYIFRNFCGIIADFAKQFCSLSKIQHLREGERCNAFDEEVRYKDIKVEKFQIQQSSQGSKCPKTKLPKFDGDELEFPEFIMKNTTLVTNANFLEKTELDKLSDAANLQQAWDIIKCVLKKVFF